MASGFNQFKKYRFNIMKTFAAKKTPNKSPGKMPGKMPKKGC